MEHKISVSDLKIAFDSKVIYDPLPQQRKFHMSTAKYRLLGGAVGGGKTIGIIGEALMRSLKYDFPITGAIFRRSFPELEATIIRTMLNMLPTWFYKYNQQQHLMTLKNGSMIEFCYAESDNDVIRYQSREWDWLAMDELTHFSQFQWSYLLSRLRTTKPINTKFFAATNPGSRGHNFVKERWITKNCKDENYKPNEYDFIPAGIMENPYILESNPDYIENLKMLPEKERKALLEGNWDIFEGVFFPEWSFSKHVVDDFDVPEDWQLVMGWDDGTREPRAVYVCAIDPDQKVWCVWEYYKAGENLVQAAETIRSKLKEAGYWGRIYKCVVDPSMKREDSQTGINSVEVLEGMGFGFQLGSIELGNNDRVEGWRIMKSYMMFKPYEEPLFKVFRSCSNFIRTVPQLIYYQPKSNATSKKEDLNSDSEDHCLTGDTKVYVLDSGREKEASLRQLVGTEGYIKTLGGYSKYDTARKTGHKKVLKITFNDGTFIKGTPEHPLLTENFEWKSLKDFCIGDKAIGIRARELIQLDTNKSNSCKQDNSGVFGNTLLQVQDILSKAWGKVAQGCLGVPLWKDTDWLSYTSQGWELSEQYNRKLGITQRVPTSFLSRKEYERSNKEDIKGTTSKCKRTGEGVAPLRGGEEVAQREWKESMEESRGRGKGLSVLWKDLLHEASWGFKVLSSKLQGKCKTKKVKRIEVIGYRDVYNLRVNDVHCFLEGGGVVVHNSADAVRYLLMSLDRLPSRFESNTFLQVKRRKYSPVSKY